MTASGPGTPDPAWKAARVLWERATGKTWSPAMADQIPSQLVATAYEWLCIFQTAGLSVTEQPPERVVLSSPLRALAVEWLRTGRRVRDTGGDVAVAAAFEQHGTLLLEFLGEDMRAEHQAGEPR